MKIRIAGSVARLALAATVLVGVAGCAKTEAAHTGDRASGSGACGTVPHRPVEDPDHALAGLTPTYAKNYSGYINTVHKSHWANWKPAKATGFTVGIIMANTDNAPQASLLAAMKAGLADHPRISRVIVDVDNNSLPTELQQYQSLVQQGVDLIILQPLSQAAELPLVEAAAMKGIPTISPQNELPSPYDVTVNTNSFLAGATTAAAVLKEMGGKGNVLEVHGRSGIALDNDTFAGFSAALKDCPGVKVAGNVVGDFVPPTAKTETLKFLATHPQPIDGVLQAGIMSAAVASAFQQAGRQVPPMTYLFAQKADLAVWKQLAGKGDYHAAGTVQSEEAIGAAIAEIARRMLAGQGIKVTDVIAQQAPITDANLDQLVHADWTPTTGGNVEDDQESFFPKAFLDQLFTRPTVELD